MNKFKERPNGVHPQRWAIEQLEKLTEWLHQSHRTELSVRVLEAEATPCGWGLKILESYKMPNERRRYRVVIFDVFGGVSHLSTDYHTVAEARKEFNDQVSMTDWMRTAIQHKRRLVQRDLEKLGQWEEGL